MHETAFNLLQSDANFHFTLFELKLLHQSLLKTLSLSLFLSPFVLFPISKPDKRIVSQRQDDLGLADEDVWDECCKNAKTYAL